MHLCGRCSGAAERNCNLGVTSCHYSTWMSAFTLFITKLVSLSSSSFLDPYVKVGLLHGGVRVKKWKTRAIRKTKFPVFDEAFSFDVAIWDLNDITLKVSVMDHERVGWNEVIGVTHIGPNVREKDGQVHWSKMLESAGEAVLHWHPVFHPQKIQRRRSSSALNVAI